LFLLLYVIFFSLDAITCFLVDTFINESKVQFNVNLNCGSGKHNYGDVTFQWNFGDGNTATSLYPSTTHIYQTKGNWTFTVIVSNAVSEGQHTGRVDIRQGVYLNLYTVAQGHPVAVA